MDAQRINSAAQALLTACFEAADPVKALHIELDRLRASGDWTEIEVRRIQELTLSTAKAIAANVQNHCGQFLISGSADPS